MIPLFNHSAMPRNAHETECASATQLPLVVLSQGEHHPRRYKREEGLEERTPRSLGLTQYTIHLYKQPSNIILPGPRSRSCTHTIVQQKAMLFKSNQPAPMPNSQAKQASTFSRLLQSRRQPDTTLNIWCSPIRHLLDFFAPTRAVEPSAARRDSTSKPGNLLAVLTQHATKAVLTQDTSQAVCRNGSWTSNVLAGCGVLLVEFEVLGLVLVEVLAWVCGLVLEDFDEAVEAYGNEGTEGWA